MNYCFENTEKFAHQMQCLHCLEFFNTLILREGYNGEDKMPFPDAHICLDMDNVEKTIAKTENRTTLNSSMDAAFVLDNNEVLLIEFRFNYQNLKNLNANKLKSKQFYSEQIAKNHGYTVHPNFYYVFESNMIEQARRRFRNFNPQLPQVYKPITIQNLKSEFWE